MKVAIFGIVVLLVIQAAYCTAEEWQCVPGVPYIENECNSCFCNDDGLLGCTDMYCDGEKYEELFNCKVGTISTHECNACFCVKDYGTICSNFPC